MEYNLKYDKKTENIIKKNIKNVKKENMYTDNLIIHFELETSFYEYDFFKNKDGYVLTCYTKNCNLIECRLFFDIKENVINLKSVYKNERIYKNEKYLKNYDQILFFPLFFLKNEVK